jgi:hypothetical protein
MSEELKEGAFLSSLKRNNKQIREDRAATISEDAQIKYKRMVEDTEMRIRQMRRDLDNMLDLSPDNAMSLKLASEFDADDFVKRDVELGVKIRNEEIKLDIVKARYQYLFGI